MWWRSKTFLQLIRDIARQGTTIIIAAHHLEEIIPEIKNVALMKNSQAMYEGPTSEILTSQKLSTVYDCSLTVSQNDNGYRIEFNQKG